ncbi:FecR domain-containing protein [Cupriavidus sp. AU9028]|nr:FecR domain-containing protein [Cupriavidus sp. AU9028]
MPRLGLLRVAAACLTGLASAAALAGPAGADGKYFLYRVESEDTLIALAQRYTGDAGQWHALQRLNRVADPYRLKVGSLIRIPLDRIPVVGAQARVVSLVGDVRLDGKPARLHAAVHESASVETGVDGLVTFELQDGSRAVVPPRTRLQLRRLRAFAGTGLVDTVVQLEAGAMESRVAPEGGGVGRFEVRTPMMVTGVRGTRFDVDAGQPGQGIGVGTVLEGEVAVSAKSGRQRVPAGFGVAISRDGKPGAPRKLLPAPVLPPLPPGPVYDDETELAWQPVQGAAGYLVVATRDEALTEQLFSGVVQRPSARVTGLPDGEVFLSVRAIDDARLAGNPGTAKLLVRLNPPAPFTLEPAQAGREYGATVPFSWAAVETAAQYELEVAGDAGFGSPAVRLRTRDTGSAQQLTPGSWWWRVRSLDDKGEPGPWSEPVAFRLLPALPTATLSEDSNGALRLRWSASGSAPQGVRDTVSEAGEVAYRVQLAADPAFERIVEDRIVQGTEAALARPTAGPYWFRVARREADGTVSPFSPAQRIELFDLLRDGTGGAVGAGAGPLRRGG